MIGTGIDITDRRDAEIRLQRLQAELARQVQGGEALTRELEAIKGELDRFTAAVSHDLRSPLRWISGFCQALEAASAHRLDSQGAPVSPAAAPMIRQTEELTEALLQHARLARAVVQRQEIDLSDQAHTIAAALKRTAPARRVEFIIGTNLRAKGDPAMLREVLSTLLGNAWKFTETVPRGKIEVRGPARHGRDPGLPGPGQPGRPGPERRPRLVQSVSPFGPPSGTFPAPAPAWPRCSASSSVTAAASGPKSI